MIRVGSPGDKGSVEISDLLFTASGPTAGLVAVEWNIEADSKGSAGMWGAKFVVLHTPISLLTREQIRISASVARKAAPSKLPTAQNQRVRLVANAWGASLLLHLTASSSAYLENVWAWWVYSMKTSGCHSRR